MIHLIGFQLVSVAFFCSLFFSILLTFTTLLWVQFLEYLIIFSNYEHTHKVEDKEVETWEKKINILRQKINHCCKNNLDMFWLSKKNW